MATVYTPSWIIGRPLPLPTLKCLRHGDPSPGGESLQASTVPRHRATIIAPAPCAGAAPCRVGTGNDEAIAREPGRQPGAVRDARAGRRREAARAKDHRRGGPAWGIGQRWMCHCFGVLGEAVRVASQFSTGTACPKAAKQWHAVSSARIKPGHPARGRWHSTRSGLIRHHPRSK